MYNSFKIIFIILTTIGLSSCKKSEDLVIKDNVIADYHGIPTVKVENYINRMYIDLLGREPLDEEMERDVKLLKDNNLDFETRDEIINRLQHDSSFVEGDSSYLRAYHQRIYDLMKARFLEGASEGDINERSGPAYFSLRVARENGDSIGVFRALETIGRYERLLDSRAEFQKGTITFNEMCARMLDNGIYDIINMNSFNFVNASFDDLFFRFPSKDEFERAYDIIEYNKTASVFGKGASNKREYCLALVQSREFYESTIRWCYFSLINREPNTQEIYNRLNEYYQKGNLKELQRTIIRTDEYARF